MCKCCSHGKGSKKNSLYEFLNAHPHGHDAMEHDHEHHHADEHDDLEGHKAASDHHHREHEPH